MLREAQHERIFLVIQVLSVHAELFNM